MINKIGIGLLSLFGVISNLFAGSAMAAENASATAAILSVTTDASDTFWAWVTDNLLIIAGFFLFFLGLIFFKRIVRWATGR